MTTFVLCSGPSLSKESIALVEREHVAGNGRVIVTNRTFEAAPFADTCFGIDEKWWKYNAGKVRKTGMEMLTTSNFATRYGVKEVRRSPRDGLSRDGVTGKNTGHCAISYGWLTDPEGPIVVLGFDLQHINGETHHHGGHPIAEDGTKFQNANQLDSAREQAESLAEDARVMNAPIINCSPYSSRWLKLEHMTLKEFLNGC